MMLSENYNFESVKRRLKGVYRKMETLENLRKTMQFVFVAALATDPLFFFIPVIDSHRFCFTWDKKLGAALCVFRTFIDTFYVIHIIFHFITEVITPRSQKSSKGELIVNSKAIRRKRMLFYFIVDIFSILPIPQVVVFTLIRRKQQFASLENKEILKSVMICQSIPRIIRFCPHIKEETRASGTIAETKWIGGFGAALNIFLYMLMSHLFGAIWYLGAIEKKSRCWQEACAKTPGCSPTNLYCRRGGSDNSRFLNTSCPLIDPAQITNSTVFNFGMYIDALKSGVVESMDFPRKFFYCFWWGLRNLSALGQNLETSNSLWENFFAIIICISGLLLYAVLFGNVQKYLQSTTIRVDEMEEKKRDREKWMSNRKLPEDLKNRIRRYESYKWQETRGAEEDAYLRSLPKGLRIEIKRHLYLEILQKVPVLQDFDDELLYELCIRIKTVLYTKNSYILREGDPVEDMFFILKGDLMSSSTHGERIRVFLSAGDFCNNLLSWALDPHTTQLPISSITVEALTKVEVFVLSADDLKFVATQHRRSQSREVQHMFRYHSEKWRTWASYFIQAAWRRHCKRKLSKALREVEGKLRNTLRNDDSGSNKLNWGATIYASKFASTALRNRRAKAAARKL